jgi:NAD(P)-dependent dehydrogenase (short-subunit alcohol dehydrogenase family)
VVADINEAGAKATASELPDAMSSFRANVASQEDWRRLMETTQSRYGRVDCLVNNAGTTYKNKVRLLSMLTTAKETSDVISR